VTRRLPPDDLSHSSTEAAVADVFGQVLELPEIPSDVSFFYLGGMSLDAIRACALLSDRLGVAIGLSTFLENQTVRELGLAIALGPSRDASVPAVDVAGPANRVPLTAIQAEILLQEIMGGKPSSAHCIMSWRIRGSVDPSALEKAVQDVHRRHEALRACYSLDDVPHASVPDGPASAQW
jgi:mycobactin peptide synthetase MbtE